MQVLSKKDVSTSDELLKKLCISLEGHAKSERFIEKAIKDCIEEINSEKTDLSESDDEILCLLSDPDLINLLAEKIYLDALGKGYEPLNSEGLEK